MSTVKNRIPQEEIDRANSVNLPRFLMSRGIELKRVGREYTMPEHDSLRIYDNQPGESGKWFRFSEGKGGGNIDFCEKFLGMDFRESVQSLNGDRIENLNFANEKAAKKPIEKREINIIKNGDMKRSFAYLSKTRGLNYNMIRDLAKQGKIVQEAGTGNVVFLINDENNKLVGAEKVGTSTEKRFKGIAADSNPEYGFEIVKGKGEKALFFESAIDMLSYVQLHEKELDNHRLISMTGLKDVTVEATVKRNGIAPENVYICSDNDAAGNKFAVKMREKYPQIKRITAGSQFKDWNDQLRGITVKIENIPRQQDISNNNADPSAQRGERKNTMNTKFEVSSMTMMDDPKVKAIASVAVNNELIVSGITVRENQKGELYVKMPQQKNGRDEQGKDKYEDRVFPTTAEARKALDEAVLGAYENLASQGLENSYVKIEPPEKSASKLSVSLIKTDSEKSSLKAKGQITIDNCFVIKDVKVSEHTNSKTGEKFNSVDLPHFKQNQNGEYPLVVKPITADIRGKINEAVMTSFNAQTRGVKFSELGGKENVDTYFRQNNQFAEKLMNKLEEKGIPYHAKIADTTTISVNKSDKAAVENIKKEITAETRKPSVLGEVNKIKAEQKAKEAESPTQQKAKSNAQER